MNRKSLPTVLLLCVSGLTLVIALYLLSSRNKTAPVSPVQFEEAKSFLNSNGDINNSVEASAVEMIDNQYMLVAHDKSAVLHVYDIETGKFVSALSASAFPTEAKEPPKWEAMSQFNGVYYLLGSHGGKSDAERDAHSYLYRFTLKGQGKNVEIDGKSVRRWHIAKSLKKVCLAETRHPEKRKLEGLDVCMRNGKLQLLVGLRNPDDHVRVMAADISNDPKNDAELELHTLFSFDAGKIEGENFQLGSLQSIHGGFLIVTLTENSINEFFGNALWYVPDNGKFEPKKICEFADGKDGQPPMKCEGMCVLYEPQDGSSVKLLFTYDNDSHVTGTPSKFQIVTYSRR